MAKEAWVRGAASRSPARARRHASAFEFHWGKPPPAAAPRTTAFIAAAIDYPAAMPLRAQRWLEIGAGVGIDFHADGNLDDARGLPSHGFAPLKWTKNDAENSNKVSRFARQVVSDHLDVLVVQCH